MNTLLHSIWGCDARGTHSIGGIHETELLKGVIELKDLCRARFILS